MVSQSMKIPLQPGGFAAPLPSPLTGCCKAHRIKRRVRNVRRLQLLCFLRFNEVTEPRHAPLRVRTHVETSAAPEPDSLSQFQTFQDPQGIFHHMIGLPHLDVGLRPQVAVTGGHGSHARSASGHDVALVIAHVHAV